MSDFPASRLSRRRALAGMLLAPLAPSLAGLSAWAGVPAVASAASTSTDPLVAAFEGWCAGKTFVVTEPLRG